MQQSFLCCLKTPSLIDYDGCTHFTMFHDIESMLSGLTFRNLIYVFIVTYISVINKKSCENISSAILNNAQVSSFSTVNDGQSHWPAPSDDQIFNLCPSYQRGAGLNFRLWEQEQKLHSQVLGTHT